MAASPPPAGARRRLPLSVFLAAAIGLAMLVALGLVLWLTLSTAWRNTEQLLADKARLVLTLIETRTEQFLAPAEALTKELARRLGEGTLDRRSAEGLAAALRFALAAAPQLRAAAFADIDGRLVSVYRTAEGGIGSRENSWLDDEAIARMMQPLQDASDVKAGWGEPLFVAATATTQIYYAQPASVDGMVAGAVIATTSVPELSAHLTTIARSAGVDAFILYGRDRVLAHSALARPGQLIRAGNPLPTLGELGDPALVPLWAEGYADRRISALGEAAHLSQGAVDRYVYLYRELAAARAVPWLVGGYFRADDLGREVQQINRATVAAAALVLSSLLGAVLLGRMLARPASEIAAQAQAVSRLELGGLQPLAGSRIRELDDAERSLNSMVAALRCFVRYLPADLVHYVIRHPERDIGRPARRPMTILFTDISGFTTLAEDLDPETVGALLNRHFADLEACIRATGGVIDKYLGDGLLAFWGAPEPLADHSARAVEAALAMAAVVRQRNEAGGPALRLRVGLAAGEILVGDLGAPTRTNYTVIGDTVNLAQRLLEMGHVAAPAHATVIVTTAGLIREIPAERRPVVRRLGEHQVRGRHGAVELVEIVGPGAPALPAA